MRHYYFGIALLLYFVSSFAQDWTYKIGPEKHGKQEWNAYLWIPSSAENGLRGLILTVHISAEQNFVLDKKIRSTASKEKLAIIYFKPSPISIMKVDSLQNDTLFFLSTLDKFAQISGFTEIHHIPWITFAHSTGCNFALSLAYWKPEKTIAVICYKGGIVPRPDWAKKELHYVPLMVMQGEYEEHDKTPGQFATDSSSKWVRQDVLRLRAIDHSKFLVNATLLPGEGHMLWTKQGIDLIAKFISKSVKYRVPQRITKDTLYTLIDIKEEKGFGSTGDPHNEIGKVIVDTIPKLANKDSSYWFFDREFARVWYNLQKKTQKQRQFVCTPDIPPTISPDPYRKLEYKDTSKTYETRLLIGTKYIIRGSSNTKLSTTTMLQSGPAFFNKDTLIIDPSNIRDETTIRIGLRQDGDSIYKPSDRMIKARLNKRPGKEQVITVLNLPDSIRVGSTINLDVNSSSGLPVFVSVNAGPGIVKGKQLKVLPFTSKSQSSRIYLRAGQGGDSVFATAEPVEFSIPVFTGKKKSTNQNLGSK